jgi:hypothetical protein
MLMLANPLGGGRAFLAFAEHYAGTFPIEEVSFDHWHEAGRVVARDFGGSTSLTGAAGANPGALARYLVSNIAKLPTAVYYCVRPDLDLPLGITWVLTAACGLGLATLVLGHLLALRRTGQLGLRVTTSALAAFFVAVVAAVTVELAIVPPEPRYVAPLVVPLIVLAASRPWRRTTARRSIFVLAGTAVGTLLIVPNIAHGLCPQRPYTTPSAVLPERAIARALSGLRLPARLRVLDAGANRLVYAGVEPELVAINQKAVNERLAAFLSEQRVDIAIIDEWLVRNSLYHGDPDVIRVVNGETLQGWRRFQPTSTPVVILVRDDVTSSDPPGRAADPASPGTKRDQPGGPI